ncbi:streptococcal hemagglutinin-like [Dermacentor albipictus]|uniref:streptococcal hemagglutinin-like n=1 Tax=Dermacentor albipictus TaxID=60249 RepID=UPI0038FC59B8
MEANDSSPVNIGASDLVRSRNLEALLKESGRLLRSRQPCSASTVKRVRKPRVTSSGRGRAPPRRILAATSLAEARDNPTAHSQSPVAEEPAPLQTPQSFPTEDTLSIPEAADPSPVVSFYFVSPVTAEPHASEMQATTTDTRPSLTPEDVPSASSDSDKKREESRESSVSSPASSTSGTSTSPASSLHGFDIPQPSPSADSCELTNTSEESSTSTLASENTSSPLAAEPCAENETHPAASPANERHDGTHARREEQASLPTCNASSPAVEEEKMLHFSSACDRNTSLVDYEASDSSANAGDTPRARPAKHLGGASSASGATAHARDSFPPRAAASPAPRPVAALSATDKAAPHVNTEATALPHSSLSVRTAASSPRGRPPLNDAPPAVNTPASVPEI